MQVQRPTAKPPRNNKGKEEYLYSAIYMYISKRSGMDHTVLRANKPFLRKRSPDGATRN